MLSKNMQLSVLALSESEIKEAVLQEPAEILPFLKNYTMVWLNVIGIDQGVTIQKIADIFQLNPLAVEDIMDTHQRVKLEEYDHECFAVSKIPEIIKDELNLQQLCIFWGQNFVITFEESGADCFAPLFARIKAGKHHESFLLPEYVVYCILDIVIDSFFPILEDYGARLDDLETGAISSQSTAVISKIHKFKHDLHIMRRAIWSQRDAIGSFKNIVMDDKTMWFHVRDCEDHTIQLLDLVESYTDRGSSLMDIYLVSVSNRINQIVKQLTIIATIVMPIGVLAGIYGMNFDRQSPWNLPELGWRFGYEYFWGVVIIFASIMIFMFWRKGWFKR